MCNTLTVLHGCATRIGIGGSLLFCWGFFFVPSGKFIIKDTVENKISLCSSTTGIYTQANSLHFFQLKADIFNTLLALHVQVSGSGSVPVYTKG